MSRHIIDAYLYFVKYKNEKNIFKRIEKTTRWDDRRTLCLDSLVRCYGYNFDKAEWRKNQSTMDALIRGNDWFWNK